MSPMNWDWLGGIVDGEGSFNISFQARYYKDHPSIRFDSRVVIAIKHGGDWLIPQIHEFIGYGKRYVRKDGTGLWQTTKLVEATRFTETIRSHLILKHAIAGRFLEAITLLPISRKGVNQMAGERVISYDVALKVTEIALSLNPGGRCYRRRNPQAIEEWRETLRAIYA